MSYVAFQKVNLLFRRENGTITLNKDTIYSVGKLKIIIVANIVMSNGSYIIMI